MLGLPLSLHRFSLAEAPRGFRAAARLMQGVSMGRANVRSLKSVPALVRVSDSHSAVLDRGADVAQRLVQSDEISGSLRSVPPVFLFDGEVDSDPRRLLRLGQTPERLQAKGGLVEQPGLGWGREIGRDATPGRIEEAGDGAEVRAIGAEFPCAVEAVRFHTAQDAAYIDLGVTAVRHGLIERLQIVERWRFFVRRRRGEMLIEPLMRRFPRLGAALAQLLGEIFAQQRMSVERDERAAEVTVDRDELGVSEPRQHDVALRLAQ